MLLRQTIWLSFIAFEGALVVRAFWGRFFSKYLVFYLYLSHVTILDLVHFYVKFAKPSSYPAFYWSTEFVSVAVGYCVIWEIYQQALAPYPGTLRMARCLVLGIFIVVLAKGVINGATGPVWGQVDTVAELERNLRAVEVFLIVAIVIVLGYYMVPIGWNLRGILLGYGFFIGVAVINNTVRVHLGYDAFHLWWDAFQRSAWLITLVIWAFTLWSHHPNPAPEAEVRIERDYESLSERTALALGKARSFLLRGVR